MGSSRTVRRAAVRCAPMDAGLAAVLGALAGAGGAVGAGLIAGVSQWKTAKLGARAEHTRQRRESRQIAYAKFIEAHMEFAQLLHPLRFESVPRRELFTSEAARKVDAACDRVQLTFIDVALCGPRKVTQVADEQRKVSNAARGRFREISCCYLGVPGYGESAIPGFWESLCSGVGDISIRSFLESAPIALDAYASKD